MSLPWTTRHARRGALQPAAAAAQTGGQRTLSRVGVDTQREEVAAPFFFFFFHFFVRLSTHNYTRRR